MAPAGPGTLPETVAEALQQVTAQARLPPVAAEHAAAVAQAAAHDAAALLAAGRGAVLCTLAHISRVVARRNWDAADRRGCKERRRAQRQRLQHAARKLAFLMSVVNETSESDLLRLQQALLAYCGELQSAQGGVRPDVPLTTER